MSARMSWQALAHVIGLIARAVPFTALAVATTSAIAADDLCIEDGGQAMCIGPEIPPWRYIVGEPGINGGWQPSEAAAIEGYRQNRLAGGVCSVVVTDMTPPWLEGETPEGQGGEQHGNSQNAQALNGTYVERGWVLSTEHAQSKTPLRLDITGSTNTNCNTSNSYGITITRDRSLYCPGNPSNLGDWDRWHINQQSPPLVAYCWRWPSSGPEPRKNLGQQCTTLGNPVNAASGNKVAVEVDYAARGASPLKFVRTYNSGLWADSSAPPSGHNSVSRMGPNWRSNFDAWISLSGGGRFTTAYAYRPDGRTLYFKLTQGVFRGEADISDRLQQLTNGSGQLIGWLYTVAKTEEVETYNTLGRLTSIKDRAGKQLSVQYDVNGRISSVADDFGKALTFSYDASNRLATVLDPAGNAYTYTYNVVGNVLSVTRPGSSPLTYVYGEQASPYALTGIIDENNNRFSTYKYNFDGRVTSTEHAAGVEKYLFNYARTGGTYTNASTTVTDPLGQSRIHTLATIHGVSRLIGMNQPCSSGCVGGGAAALAYDPNANVASRTDFNGNTTCYQYDLARNLEEVRVEGFAQGMSCPANLATYTPAIGTRQRKITTQWHAIFRLPTQIDEPGKRTTYAHDANGNVLTKTELDTATSTSRIWTYTYNGIGQVLTADGPRTDLSDVTTYTYYTCTTGYQCGQVHTITNALSHVTTFSSYNAHGQPLTITEPNGVITTLTYDLRQRLTSRTIGTEQTTFDYWPTGLLKKVTLTDNSFIQYTYDDAHRLTQIADADGNRIVYTLDEMGNHTAEQSYDPSNALTRTRTRVFNTLNQLWKEIGAAGTANVATTFSYDSNGNQTDINAPLSRNTTQTYDELNRLKQVTDPLSGITQYGYNALDQLISVTDPRSKVTSYTYNALGDLTQQVSPDTGTTLNTYDSGGNRKTSKDARNKTATYSYDALNRVTQIAYGDQTITYGYDAGSNGIGRLTSTSDSGHSLSFSYDAQGRLTSKTQVSGSLTRTASYGYTNGQLTSLTTPSGQVVTYGYANGQVTSIKVNGVSLLSNVLYDPFGPPRQCTWGNGSLAVRTLDQDGKITQIDSAGLKTYAYDDAFRITGITDAADNSLSWSYGYDAFDRLTSANKTGSTFGYSYDANGNRLSQSGTSSSSYTMVAASNRLSSITGSLNRTYTYDAAGNTLTYGTHTLAYNNRGRMKSLNNGSVATNYTYNALGQLIKKNNTTITQHYYYDEAGHLLGEYFVNGGMIQETVWLGDIPVATLRPKTGGVDIFYVHTDHLNTPRKITRSSDNKLRWRWDPDAFGNGAPNENPQSLGVFKYTLRLPGQVYLEEAGLHYNYMRSFDPITARYMESDPIGLWGGLSTYAYVGSDPLTFADPLGLAKCTYSITKHKMSCSSNGGDRTVDIGPDGVWSGIRECTNNLQCVTYGDAGPVPPGEYKMNRDDRERNRGKKFWRLEPVPKIPGWKCGIFARCGFMFHLGSVSKGCITVDKFDPDLTKQFDRINEMLIGEDGHNTLTVEP